MSEEDTIRIKTRVVFVDALVKDKKTGESVADLKQENFEVLADGKLRTLSYFSREGDTNRRPLALILVLGGKDVRRAEVLDSLAR